MLDEILNYLGWYRSPDCPYVSDVYVGDYEISGATLAPSDFLTDGQYFRIIGSKFNDGLHRFPAYDLEKESFHGSVWVINIPHAVEALAEEIESYCAEEKKNDVESGWGMFQSQSFGGYSGTVKDDTSWQTKYHNRLNEWRVPKI